MATLIVVLFSLPGLAALPIAMWEALSVPAEPYTPRHADPRTLGRGEERA